MGDRQRSEAPNSKPAGDRPLRTLRRTVQKAFHLWREAGVPGTAAIAVTALLRWAGGLEALELSAYDRFMASRPPEPIDARVILIGINEEDINQTGYPVPDGVLAAAIATLDDLGARAIGVDLFRDLPIAPGTEALRRVFAQRDRVVAIERAILPGAVVYPPPDVPPQRVGFADVLLDGDGRTRRHLMSAPRLEGGYGFALALRLAARYLQAEGIDMENGIRDRAAIRFRQVEFDRLRPNTGGYARLDPGGNQVLLNYRRHPFSRYGLQEVLQGKLRPQDVRDRVVLIGMTAESVKDTLLVPAANDDLLDGVEFHAHAVSQILAAVLDDRPLIRALPEAWEYVWIAAWGGLGIALGSLKRSPWVAFGGLAAAALLLVGGCYGLLVAGWWIPVVPTAIALVMAGTSTRYVGDLRSLIAQRQATLEQRQRTLEEAFDAMHNGPLHTLAEILSSLGDYDRDKLAGKLRDLDRELREVYETMRPDRQAQEIDAPLHEMLYEVYHRTMQRNFAGFKTLKVKVADIQPLPAADLAIAEKRELCAFFEEALCNVGKHAVAPTRLTALWRQEGDRFVLRVADNGKTEGTAIAANPQPPGQQRTRGGTKHAKALARKLGGTFRREVQAPQGVVCEITWPIARS